MYRDFSYPNLTISKCQLYFIITLGVFFFFIFVLFQSNFSSWLCDGSATSLQSDCHQQEAWISSVENMTWNARFLKKMLLKVQCLRLAHFISTYSVWSILSPDQWIFFDALASYLNHHNLKKKYTVIDLRNRIAVFSKKKKIIEMNNLLHNILLVFYNLPNVSVSGNINNKKYGLGENSS